jgi:hypothetical protein
MAGVGSIILLVSVLISSKDLLQEVAAREITQNTTAFIHIFFIVID